MEKPPFDLSKALNDCKTLEDLLGDGGVIKKLIKHSVENMLEAEMSEHLGYKKNEQKNKKTKNSRNGTSKKTVKSSHGPVELDIPRDRDSDFEPIAVKKHQRDISSFDQKIISMYARGMTTRDIQEHVREIYGVDVSAAMISLITNKVMSHALEWQNRPLEQVYVVVYFDAIHYKVRHNNKIVNKAAYTVLGISNEGKKDILGIWIGENEGAAYWLSVINELKNRGIEDILIACMDGLPGLPDAVEAVFPNVEIQRCIIHLIRSSAKYIPHAKRAAFIGCLKKIYQANSEEEATHALDELNEDWGAKYPLAVKPWNVGWHHIVTFLKYPQELRRMIYTTNAVEAVHRQFRKVTKTRSILANDESLFKILYLATANMTKKWKHPVRNWQTILTQLHILFKERLMIK